MYSLIVYIFPTRKRENYCRADNLLELLYCNAVSVIKEKEGQRFFKEYCLESKIYIYCRSLKGLFLESISFYR